MAIFKSFSQSMLNSILTRVLSEFSSQSILQLCISPRSCRNSDTVVFSLNIFSSASVLFKQTGMRAYCCFGTSSILFLIWSRDSSKSCARIFNVLIIRCRKFLHLLSKFILVHLSIYSHVLLWCRIKHYMFAVRVYCSSSVKALYMAHLEARSFLWWVTEASSSQVSHMFPSVISSLRGKPPPIWGLPVADFCKAQPWVGSITVTINLCRVNCYSSDDAKQKK